ncbi:MAG: molybdate ABC transporter substrate-binding protein [Acidimicrobiales bacterium]
MRRRHPTLVLLAASVIFVVASCGGSDPSPDQSGTPTTAGLTGAIKVSDAASLTDAYAEIGTEFEKAHPGTKVTFNPDSSSTLADQILSGAPADVFASADDANMTRLTDAKLVSEKATIFARNQLVIVTKPGNPEKIMGLADLATVGTISLCGEDVPCGKYAKQVLDGAGVTIPEDHITRGQNVKATLTAVTEGDAVAAIVYVTDAKAAADKVAVVDIAKGQDAIATYPVAVLKSTKAPAVARAFVAYVTSGRGQAILQRYGFLPPS